ncbi:hypothetical protein ACFSUJ_00070 [Streptomyces lusitanus]|uniref:MftR C-terminal domain-containing protein n=1 Tax=Streptomyces lusitanus TaxID=68232 RepID=A0ABU3K2J4_9ACTN|nr:hypothetical protein [Streptomyces lusitanus]
MYGLGLGIALPTAMDAALGALSEDTAGVGSGVNQSVRTLGGSFGAAVLGSVLNCGYRGDLNLGGVPAQARGAVEDSVFGGLAVAREIKSEALADSVRSAYVTALDSVLVVSGVLGLLGVLLAVVWLPRQVSQAPSTVFRHFATKQDLVFSQDYDLPFVAMFGAQSPELTPIQAERRAIRSLLHDISEQELALQRERFALIVSEPELWGPSLDSIRRTIRLLAEEVAERAGREARDPAVRAYTGAVFGVMLQVSMDWANDPGMDSAATLDEALGHLEHLRP